MQLPLKDATFTQDIAVKKMTWRIKRLVMKRCRPSVIKITPERKVVVVDIVVRVSVRDEASKLQGRVGVHLTMNYFWHVISVLGYGTAN